MPEHQRVPGQRKPETRSPGQEGSRSRTEGMPVVRIPGRAGRPRWVSRSQAGPGRAGEVSGAGRAGGSRERLRVPGRLRLRAALPLRPGATETAVRRPRDRAPSARSGRTAERRAHRVPTSRTATPRPLGGRDFLYCCSPPPPPRVEHPHRLTGKSSTQSAA